MQKCRSDDSILKIFVLWTKNGAVSGGKHPVLPRNFAKIGKIPEAICTPAFMMKILMI